MQHEGARERSSRRQRADDPDPVPCVGQPGSVGQARRGAPQLGERGSHDARQLLIRIMATLSPLDHDHGRPFGESETDRERRGIRSIGARRLACPIRGDAAGRAQLGQRRGDAPQPRTLGLVHLEHPLVRPSK